MGRNGYVARSSDGTQHVNTVRAVPHPTFAIAEFFRTSDSDKMRASWLGWGFKDITPIWSAERKVHTFTTDADVPQWPTFQTQLADVHADWFYLSGHHGRQFSSDWDPTTDVTNHYNTETEVGFFNERYHRGRWSHNSQANPGVAQPNEVFMSMTDIPPIAPLGFSDNPLYFSKQPDCLGMILMGCNTLAYKSMRKAMMTAFPKAVIIGYTGQTPVGDEALVPIQRVCTRSFFESPPTDADSLKKLVVKLNKNYIIPGTLAIQQGSSLFWTDNKATTADVQGAGDDF